MIAFTCCVNYADMLAITYPFNRRYFDELVVVTSPGDFATIGFCQANGISFILSDCYKQNGSTFNRAAMLNQAIDYCIMAYPGEWFISMDADVIMDVVDCNTTGRNIWLADWCSMDTRQECFFGGELDKEMIYGCPRKMIRQRTELTIENLRKPEIGEWENYPYNLSAYLGFFQMFYKRTARNDESYKTVENSDTAFLDNNFGINKARVFKNLVCYHLGESGVNWNGRISREWK